MPAVSAPLSVLAVWAIGLRLTGDRRVAAWAAIFANLTGAAVLSFVAWPDEPMVLAWLWAAFGLAAVYKGGAPAWWTLPARPPHRRQLQVCRAVPGAGAVRLDPGRAVDAPPVCIALAMAGAVAGTGDVPGAGLERHPWLAVAHHADHAGRPLHLGLVRASSYLTNIAAMSSPPLLVLALITLVRGPERRLLLLAILPMALFLAAFSQTDEVGIHWVWPMTYWVSLAAALAMSGTRLRWWNGGLATRPAARRRRDPARRSVAHLPTGLYGADPGRPFRGWPEVALAVEQLRQQHGATYMLGDRYFHPGYLKLALGADAPVFNVNHPGATTPSTAAGDAGTAFRRRPPKWPTTRRCSSAAPMSRGSTTTPWFRSAR